MLDLTKNNCCQLQWSQRRFKLTLSSQEILSRPRNRNYDLIKVYISPTSSLVGSSTSVTPANHSTRVTIFGE